MKNKLEDIEEWFVEIKDDEWETEGECMDRYNKQIKSMVKELDNAESLNDYAQALADLLAVVCTAYLETREEKK